jgi:integrase
MLPKPLEAEMNELTITQPTDLTHPLTVGQIANQAAARAAFTDYRSRKAQNTLIRQDGDLALFADYLAEVGAAVGCLSFATDPACWQGVTWGLVEGFIRWQLKQGFAVSSVNVRLSTVKGYAKLAVKAGGLDKTEYAMIRTVSGYSHREGKRIDEARQLADIPTRFDRPGAKKAEAVSLTKDQAAALKSQPATPQGRRDALLMALLLDLGLRVGEVALLQVSDFDLKAGVLRFYRPKVDLEQTHKLTPDTLKAARAYLGGDAPAIGPVLRGSRKDGRLHAAGMSERAITKRVCDLGRAIGIDGLSAHDCRHFWATTAARNGTPLDRLQDAGGWSSPAMPLRYVERAGIANEGIRLD